jgi:hypothetical protein
MEQGLILASIVFPIFFLMAINIVIAIIAMGMAKKRGLRPVPAFFAGFFGSFLALFFIAMFTAREPNQN